MRRFCKILALFLAPLALVCGLFSAVLLRSGELAATESVVRQTLDGTLTLFGLAYRDDTRAYKQQVACAKKADLLVLGTSRSMQLRGEFFSAFDGTFYNAGGGIAYVQQALPFLQSLPKDALPENLLLVLDQYFFCPGWAEVPAGSAPVRYDFTKPAVPYAFRRVLTDYADGKYRLWDVLAAPAGVYGMAAAGRGAGFYADGSYSYGTAVEHPEKSLDYGFADTFARIAQSTSRFEQADAPSEAMLRETAALLAWCRENGIRVTAVLPPYAPAVVQRMDETGRYGYMDALPAALGAVCSAYGAELVDCTRMEETADAQYIDGFHGSDRVYAAVCLRLAAQSAYLSGCFDTAFLTRLFTAEGNPLTVNFGA